MSGIADGLARAEAKLDDWGRGAWIALMVLGFIVFWPLGLLLLGYMIWSGRMGCSRNRSHWSGWSRAGSSTSKDKAEFDQFMDDRKRGNGGQQGELQPAS